jgi:hypothetical protein
MLTDSVPVGQATPIDVLHDDVVLEIFDFHVTGDSYQAMKAWQSLVHVCRRWRNLVFASPRRLSLRLVCTAGTPAKEILDAWPALPLIVDGAISSTSVDNIVDALEHNDRVCEIHLRITGRLQWDKVLAAMQVSFPALTRLLLLCDEGETPVIPDTFLGGSAPRLRYFTLVEIPFPGIPYLLLSATHLVDLYLQHIPHSGYVSPEVMAACLSMLTSLDNLSLCLEFSYSRLRRRPPPMTRSILPDLTWFRFKGVSEYMDDLVAWIDAPQLGRLSITFLDQMIFDTRHLVQFISRIPRFEEPNEAHVTLGRNAEIRLLWASDDYYARLDLEILYEDSEADPQPSFIAQVCATCLPPLPTVEKLLFGVYTENLSSDWKVDVESDQWLELLRPFTAVKSLHLSRESALVIAAALQEPIGSRITELLPSLRSIFVERLELPVHFQ